MNETQEYLQIMAGRKRLELEYKTGEFVSGYTASGLHARIIESLHCGQYVDGWGFLVDREFEDGDIFRMKRHYFEWKEMNEVQKQLEIEQEEKERKEKEELLSDVIWEHQEQLKLYGDRSYLHKLYLKNREFIFEEKKIAGMGRVIVPQYKIYQNLLGEPLPEHTEDGWCWTFIQDGKEKKLLMSEEEERAYLIVYRYGFLH